MPSHISGIGDVFWQFSLTPATTNGMFHFANRLGVTRNQKLILLSKIGLLFNLILHEKNYQILRIQNGCLFLSSPSVC
jgi:hypothetical protein